MELRADDVVAADDGGHRAAVIAMRQQMRGFGQLDLFALVPADLRIELIPALFDVRADADHARLLDQR